MNIREVALYSGAFILLIFGAYNVFTGNQSYGVLWIILGIFFLVLSQPVKQPMGAAKIRKIIIMICGIFLLVLGGYSIYMSEIYPGIAWIISGLIGLLVATMIKGPEKKVPENKNIGTKDSEEKGPEQN